MSNTGHSSGACLQCRARRVKCDESRPSCQRCTNRNIECPGYPERPLTIQDDTTRTQQRAQRIYQNLSQRRNEIRSSSRSTEHDQSQSPMKPITFGSMFDTFSLIFYTHQITVGSISALVSNLYEDGISLYLHNIRAAANMYPSCSTALKASLELLAISTFANSPAGANLDVGSSIMILYGRAMKEVKDAVQKINDNNFEETILTVEIIAIAELCLCLYEDDGDETTFRIRAHFDGMAALITQRGVALFATETGRRLFFDLCLSHVMAYSPLSLPLALPFASDAIDMLLKCPLTPRLPEYSLLPLLQRSLNLRIAAAAPSFDESQSDRSVITVFKTEAEQLRSDLHKWWVDLSDSRKSDGHCMSKLLLNNFRVHIIFVEDIYIRCCQILEDSSDSLMTDIASSTAQAQAAVREICESLPYTFTEQDIVPTRIGSLSVVEVLCMMSYSHPLLVCSMVQSLSEEEHQGIMYARLGCARQSGLSQPYRILPRTLIPVD